MSTNALTVIMAEALHAAENTPRPILIRHQFLDGSWAFFAAPPKEMKRGLTLVQLGRIKGLKVTYDDGSSVIVRAKQRSIEA